MVRRSATTSTVVECARSAIACARRIARSSTDLPESSGEAPADEARFDAAYEPDFLDLEAVIEIHERELEVSGGLAGIRDSNVLESAVIAPQNILYYEHGDLVDLAATYLYHIAKNHGFTDGNKRTGYVSCLTFLALNGTASCTGILAQAAGRRTLSETTEARIVAQ